MSTIEKSIEVSESLSTVYNQWTQFEEFPEFMEGVEEVLQLDDTKLRWKAEIAGVEREWEAQITEQVPDERIAWRSTDGSGNAGVVTFQSTGPETTNVKLQLEFEPDGITEQIGDKLGFVAKRTEADLQRFKAFIEERGRETGGWRGEVPRPSGAG